MESVGIQHLKSIEEYEDLMSEEFDYYFDIQNCFIIDSKMLRFIEKLVQDEYNKQK